jgi:serine/threonine protein kinase
MPQSRYEIVSTIGVGATSRVDKAHDTLIDRTVALKTFGHGFGSEELQKQFLREAQILGRLSHPNIVSIYDLGTNDDGSAYLVTEYVPGRTLESIIASQGLLPLSRIGVWAGDLANALNRAHRAGIIHGDVKPANILVTDEGHIKLGDFGIARFATQLSGTGRLIGTPAYLSPEQIKGEPQDHRSDIFSLGIILYQLATGVRPFDGTSVTAVCAQIVANEPPPPSHHNPELSKEFDRVVMRCLAKNPEARYASGESLAASLYPFARSKPEVAPNRFDFAWWKRPLRPRDGWIAAGFAIAAMLSIPAVQHLGRVEEVWIPGSAEAAAKTDLARAETKIESGLPAIRFSPNPLPPTAWRSNNVPANSHATTAPTENHKLEDQLRFAPSSNRRERAVLDSNAGLPGAASGSVTANNRSNLVLQPNKPASQIAARSAATPQVPLSIEISSAIDGETLAVYADQRLVATAALSVTSSGEKLHFARPLAIGPHELRVALYRPDQSLHLERSGLAELQTATANLLSIQVLRRSKILVKHDAALEILWPRALKARARKSGDAIADASVATAANK